MSQHRHSMLKRRLSSGEGTLSAPLPRQRRSNPLLPAVGSGARGGRVAVRSPFVRHCSTVSLSGRVKTGHLWTPLDATRKFLRPHVTEFVQDDSLVQNLEDSLIVPARLRIKSWQAEYVLRRVAADGLAKGVPRTLGDLDFLSRHRPIESVHELVPQGILAKQQH